MGNSIDVKCALLSLEHENYLNKKANEDNGIKDTNHSTEELQAMMNNVRVQDG